MRKFFSGHRAFFALAAVFALLAAVIGAQTLQAARHTVPVVVAATSIAPFEPITSGELQVAQVAQMDRQAGSYTSVSQLVGSVSDAPIPPGTQIVHDWINTNVPSAATQQAQTLSAQLTQDGTPQDRTYTLPVTQDQGLGGVAVGSRVDLLATVKVPVSGQEVLPASLILARNVEVLAVNAGQQQQQTSGDVTLLVTPQQAQNIALAQEFGSVSLLLNGYSSNAAAANLPPTTVLTFLQQYGLSLAPSAPATTTSSAPSLQSSKGGH